MAKVKITCPNPECDNTEFIVESAWVFSQEVIGGKPYPEFGDIIKSKTVTKKVTCFKCKKEVPESVYKHWHLDRIVE